MAETTAQSRADLLEGAFQERARAKGRTLAQEIERILDSKKPFSPEERVAVSRYFRAQHPEMQPALTLDEIRAGSE